MIEAVSEDQALKRELFGALDTPVQAGRDLRLEHLEPLDHRDRAPSRKRPDRFLGLHFFNPVPLMKLVEVVRTLAHRRCGVTQAAVRVVPRDRQAAVVTTGDHTGFVVNRLLVPYMLDAIRVLRAGAREPRRHRRRR